MGAFWNSWAIWEKLCFVLACAIVITVLVGCVKLLYERRRLQKFTVVADKKRAQLLELKENGNSVRQPRVNDVPFGIRAIESGIEVEGVWISRTNTPVPSTPDSPATSFREPGQLDVAGLSNRISTSSNISRLDLQNNQNPLAGPASSQPNSSLRNHGAPVARAVSGVRVPSRPASPTPQQDGGVRQTYQPRHSSHLRYSNPNLLRHSATLDVLEGNSRGANSSTRYSEGSEEDHKTNDTSNSSEQSGSSQGYRAPRRPPRIQVQRSSAPLGSSHLTPIESLPDVHNRHSDLEPLANHRLSHAAEVGQLIPRGRRTPISGDWTNTEKPSTQILDGVDYFDPNKGASDDNTRDPFVTPLASPATAQLAPSEVPSFRDFVSGQFTNQDPVQTSFQDFGASAVPGHTDEPEPARPNQRVRHSADARKVNSGFEILPSGTFDIQPSPENRIGQRDSTTQPKERSQANKLRKKRPESVDKRQSSMI